MTLSKLLAACAGFLFLLPLSSAAPISDEEAERLFEDDWEQRAAAVNEGRLVFLTQSPVKAIHHHHNSLIITEDSMANGWINLRQCHDNLDPVPALEIVFRPERIKDLAIESFVNIEKAWVEGSSIQLSNVGQYARICLTGIALALRKDGKDYVLRSGPFMRKFLDGYYPMRVSMDITYPDTYLRFASISPAEQPGFSLRRTGNSVHFDALFEGRLNTEVHFSAIIN